MTKKSMPVHDPITNRLICEACWNQEHKYCYADHDGTGENEMRPKGVCFCAHHDKQSSRRRPVDLSLYRDIEEEFGTIEIQ